MAAPPCEEPPVPGGGPLGGEAAATEASDLLSFFSLSGEPELEEALSQQDIHGHVFGPATARSPRCSWAPRPPATTLPTV